MKKLLLATIILLSGLTLCAQERTIDKPEFDKVMGKSYSLLRNQPYRTVEESVMESSFAQNNKYKITTENYNGARHSIFEADSPTSYMRTENIFINGKHFNKKLNNPWTEETNNPPPPTKSGFETVSNETIYKSLGEGILNDKKVAIYKTINTRSAVNKEKGNSYTVVETTAYFFDEKGLLIRSESVSEQVSKSKDEPGSAFIRKETKSTTKRIKTTEIDTSIKIEAPQVG